MIAVWILVALCVICLIAMAVHRSGRVSAVVPDTNEGINLRLVAADAVLALLSTEETK